MAHNAINRPAVNQPVKHSPDQIIQKKTNMLNIGTINLSVWLTLQVWRTFAFSCFLDSRYFADSKKKNFRLKGTESVPFENPLWFWQFTDYGKIILLKWSSKNLIENFKLSFNPVKWKIEVKEALS